MKHYPGSVSNLIVQISESQPCQRRSFWLASKFCFSISIGRWHSLPCAM